MKTSLIKLLAVSTLVAGMAVAQGHHGFGGGAPPDPATMVADQVGRLTDLLTLTAAQQTQATSIFTNAATAETSLRTNMQTAHTALAAAIKTGDTATIDNLSSQIGSLSGQEVNIQSKAQAAFYKILTADQQAKYGSGRGFGGGFGGPGGFRRGPAAQRQGGARQ